MRVNMDSSIAHDSRFKILAKRLGIDLQKVAGCCFFAWLHCYETRSERVLCEELDVAAAIEKFSEHLIGVGLGDPDGDFIIVHGVKERIKFLLGQEKRGRKGGQAKAQANAKRLLSKRSSESPANAKRLLSKRSSESPTSAQAYSPAPAHSPPLAPAPPPSPDLKTEEKDISAKPSGGNEQTTVVVTKTRPRDLLLGCDRWKSPGPIKA